MARSSKECCCCGSYAGEFEQHWNRDTGYGLCERCIDYCARGYGGLSREEFERGYGKPGIHYARAPSPGILREEPEKSNQPI
jgi:hypothetical protein